MFYGDFEGEKREKFATAMETLRECFGNVYAADNLIGLQRTAGFRADQRFTDAMKKHHKSNQELSLAWRLHTLCWAANQALDFEGALVECGVFTGFCMGVVGDYINFAATDREMYLYDTFEGIPEAYNSEKRSNAVYEQLNRSETPILQTVRDRFADWPRVHVVPGIVPDTFAETCPDRIAFLHLDMNSAASEIAALEGLFHRVVPGGFIILDDYGWTGYHAQKQAEDKWFGERGHQVLELPTGQGMVIKRP
ncbi:MAG: TylF/MycF/NovP-related O-methyltransferase [Pseudooceanicola sp.]